VFEPEMTVQLLLKHVRYGKVSLFISYRIYWSYKIFNVEFLHHGCFTVYWNQIL